MNLCGLKSPDDSDGQKGNTYGTENVEIKMAKRKGQSSDAAGVHLSSHPRLASISKVSPHAAATGRLPASPRGGCRVPPTLESSTKSTQRQPAERHTLAYNPIGQLDAIFLATLN